MLNLEIININGEDHLVIEEVPENGSTCLYLLDIPLRELDDIKDGLIIDKFYEKMYS